jgi:hypothetical protein
MARALLIHAMARTSREKMRKLKNTWLPRLKADPQPRQVKGQQPAFAAVGRALRADQESFSLDEAKSYVEHRTQINCRRSLHRPTRPA